MDLINLVANQLAVARETRRKLESKLLLLKEQTHVLAAQVGKVEDSYTYFIYWLPVYYNKLRKVFTLEVTLDNRLYLSQPADDHSEGWDCTEVPINEILNGMATIIIRAIVKENIGVSLDKFKT